MSNILTPCMAFVDPGYKDNIPIGEYTGDYVVPWCIEKSLAYVREHYDNFPTYITSLGKKSDTLFTCMHVGAHIFPFILKYL